MREVSYFYCTVCPLQCESSAMEKEAELAMALRRLGEYERVSVCVREKGREGEREGGRGREREGEGEGKGDKNRDGRCTYTMYT